jgi:hypothetical protein
MLLMLEHSEDLTVTEWCDTPVLTQRMSAAPAVRGLRVFCLAVNSASSPDIRTATSSLFIQ